MVKLDLKDRKILYELDTDSRQSFHKIAKKVGLSKDAVIYRINKFMSAGIVKKFHTIIDVGKLGLTSFRLYLKLQNVSPKKEKDVLEFLKCQKIVTWIVSIDGEYDIGMWILVKKQAQMTFLWKELLRRFGRFIEKRWLTIFTKVSYFPRTFFLENHRNRKEFVFVTEPEEFEVDTTNMRLLELLAQNSRISIIELSQKLNITPKTVMARLKWLENKRIIIGYRTLFDLEKLGYQYFKLHFNLTYSNEESEKKLRSFLKEHPAVIYINEVLGGDDIEIEIQVKTIQEFRIFLTTMKCKFAHTLRNYKYLQFYKEHKYLFFPL